MAKDNRLSGIFCHSEDNILGAQTQEYFWSRFRGPKVQALNWSGQEIRSIHEITRIQNKVTRNVPRPISCDFVDHVLCLVTALAAL